MGKKRWGLFAAAMMFAAGGAYAQEGYTEPKPERTEAMQPSELSGKVVRADNKMVHIEYMGAIVPLKIESKTEFLDPTVKRGGDLKAGQQIRASFKVVDQTNVAQSISLEKAGTEGTEEKPMPEEGPPEQ